MGLFMSINYHRSLYMSLDKKELSKVAVVLGITVGKKSAKVLEQEIEAKLAKLNSPSVNVDVNVDADSPKVYRGKHPITKELL